jgi:apolipoprotein N-acyltransferase
MPSRAEPMVAALGGFGDFVRGLAGWRALLASFIAGTFSALGFAPFGLFPFLLAGIGVLVLLMDGAARGPRFVRRAAWLGWAFGFGQFLVGLHWIFYAFIVDAAAHAWQIPFVALAFPGGLALFVSATCAVSARFWSTGVSRIFVFSAGYGWGASLGVMQSVSLFGIYALTLLTILYGAALATLFAPQPKWKLPAAMTALFALFFVGGEVRLATVPETLVHGVNLRIVQPDIPQAEKFRHSLVSRNWNRLLALSTTPGTVRPTHIVWPEAAPPFLLTHNGEALDEIAILTGQNGTLMTGSLRAFRRGEQTEYYNSFYLFGHGGELLSTYDKFHLVPFGEYLPFENFLRGLGLTKIVGIDGSFDTGDGPHTFDVPGAPAVGPLICYEILFPGAVVAARRPGWIVNVTDDSWFGPWAGPLQHLLVAQTRAIEEGIPVVRAANSGISAVIDPLGRVIALLGLNKMGVLDSGLPAAIVPTFYARFGDVGFWLLLLGCIVAARTREQSRL